MLSLLRSSSPSLRLNTLHLLKKSLCTTNALNVDQLHRDDTRPWIYLWRPGPYPRTKEERDAAAYKYGMIPEDYEPMPDDGTALGDYPNLDPSPNEIRSGFINWDYFHLRRNFGETPFHEYNFTNIKWTNVYKEGNIPIRDSIKALAMFFVPILFLVWATYDFKLIFPGGKRKTIFDGVQHYTFELDE